MGILQLSTASHVSSLYLPDDTMQPNLPSLPPPYLHTASDPRLEVRTTWERVDGGNWRYKK